MLGLLAPYDDLAQALLHCCIVELHSRDDILENLSFCRYGLLISSVFEVSLGHFDLISKRIVTGNLLFEYIFGR